MSTTEESGGWPEVAQLETAADVARAVEAFYGAPLEGDAGVLHVTSVWARGDELVTLAINRHAPPSDDDFFVLNLCRARADAIVVSGKILRDEPEVSHRLQGPGRSAEALQAWRRERLGKKRPPISLVLTSGRGLDLDHPLLSEAERALIYTTPAARRRLAEAATKRGIELVADATPALRRAIHYLKERRGAATVSIECGPSTSADLYRLPMAVDELLLSVFEGDLPEAARGGVLIGRHELESRLGLAQPPALRPSPAGPWSFWRYLRRGS